MKKRMQPNFITKHLQEYSSIYIFHTVLFLMGVIFGAIVVNSLSGTQKSDLFYFLNEFFGQLRQGDLVSANNVFIHTLSYNAKYIGLMWILGISMIGLPFILVLLFLKGMVIGFTVGFLVQQMSWKGFFLSFVSVLPQNIITIPVFIAVAVISVTFSLQMIRKLFVKSLYQPFGPMLVRYCMFFGVAVLFLCVAAFIEGYFTPHLMKGLLNILN
ncbi:stage II sporulation protein M [Caldibacillus lycopersici]|uniref:Stage II sporulation protein M n=1 Tax=Perspicuibacillus lycopersici TaxID=1325689 RepID=A0AAE3ISQ6_9BACI|nr:stage II sporulation protein M [Perspicuibacillus lycopersici]MCU9613771.1 stage II sporulation protein M [Perspicuibacillus lycopersici]